MDSPPHTPLRPINADVRACTCNCSHKDSGSGENESSSQSGHQWRPLTRNPFALPKNKDPVTPIALPRLDKEDDDEEDEKPLLGDPSPPISPAKPIQDFQSTTAKVKTEEPQQLLNPGPTWVNLFYDLAWTATFSSLTQNGKFNDVWDTVSYIAFFVVVWWIWASQALYNINFYTDDWFHLAYIFLQMVIFGMLAATTRGYDVTTYIMRSPGEETLVPEPVGEITPERHEAIMVADLSMDVIAASILISRALFLIQHLRVLAYAWRTVRQGGHTHRVPWKLYIIPFGLMVSVTSCTLAWVVASSKYGKTTTGAQLKFVFWSISLFAEIFSHIRMSRVSWYRPRFVWQRQSPSGLRRLEAGGVASQVRELPIPRSNFNLYERLEAITTIILGEGLNGIAGSLYSVISAPAFHGPIVANVACAAFIAYFLAYFYFEGPTNYTNIKDSAWLQVFSLMLHLPLLLCIVLLLVTVKNQFLLTSIISTAFGEKGGVDGCYMALYEIINGGFTTAIKTNQIIVDKLIHYRITWSKEYDDLMGLMTQNGTISYEPGSGTNEQLDQVWAWYMRTSLEIVTNVYGNFMGGKDNIPSEVQKMMVDFNQNSTWPQFNHDWSTGSDDLPLQSRYREIITDLLRSNIEGARYITALAGLILILLAGLNLAQAKLRPRFRYGAIISRVLMGLILISLLLLNVGKDQSLWASTADQPLVFRWIFSYWVLPTIAIAYGVEFLIEAVLAWLTAVDTERTATATHESLGRMAWRSIAHAFKRLNPFA